MKVLLINGSPHKEGCTYTALSEAAAALNREDIDTEIFWIGNKPVGGCVACHACDKIGKSVFDDVVNECRPKCRGGAAFATGKVIYIDGDDVTVKTTFTCEVS